MILDNISTPVQTRGGNQAEQFTIACNSKAFRVLSDTLYQNKLGSIVRELSCNAYDAHVAANCKEIPFEIHLPDSFEPWFSVQDYGIGLSPDAVKSVFTVYFQSTKDQSNDSIGAFGLGAKTPFSYTDQFTVTSVFNGTKSVYGMYITASGVPDYKLMMAEETKERNGVEIKMSVKREDYGTITKEVRQQLRYFVTKPNILNGGITWDNRSNALTTVNVRMLGASDYYQRPVLVQGMVGYPLDVTLINSKVSPAAASTLHRIQQYGPELIFNIGEIGVTASREGVEYTDTTIKNIEQKLILVQQELSAWAQETLQSIPTEYEQIEKVNATPLLSICVTDKDFKVARRIGNTFAFNLNLIDPVKKTSSGVMSRKTAGRLKMWKVTGSYTLSPSSFGAIILKDKSTRLSQKILQVQHQYHHKEVLLIELIDQDYSAKFITELQEMLGGFTKIFKASEIVLPASVLQTSTVRSRIPTYFENFGNGSDVSCWAKSYDALKEINEDILYVLLDRNVLDTGMDISNIQAYNALKEIGKVPRLLGIRLSAVDKIKLKPNFQKLSEYISTHRAKYHQDQEFLGKYQRAKFVAKMNNLSSVFSPDLQWPDAIKKTDTDLGKFHRLHAKHLTKTPDHDKIVALGDTFNVNLSPKIQKRTDRIHKVGQEVQKRYPLLISLTDYRQKASIEDIVEYVQAVYNHRKSVNK